jgi:uncharacterized protein YdhG (YjbR/CyaY superfamily)
MRTKATSIDEYIAEFPAAIQLLLQQIRTAVQDAAPAAKEKISYGMPTFELNGNLVYFAAYKNHIGFYATPTGHEAFEKDLSIYKQGKGSVQFPLDQPMPLTLIKRITAFRVKQNLSKPKKKK